MELHYLLILCISTMVGTIVGQEDFFFKVGQGFEQGKQISGWGNRNKWLQQVRGSKTPPSLKELEKWWKSPPKASVNFNSGNNGGNEDNPGATAFPNVDSNDGFVPSNWNFIGPQSGGVLPTKDPFPPFTKDAALRIKDYAALLKSQSPRTHKWAHRGKAKTKKYRHRQQRMKNARKHKGIRHNPLNGCWSPLAFECEMQKEYISPKPYRHDYSPHYNDQEVNSHFNDVVGRQQIRDMPYSDFYPSTENWEPVKEHQYPYHSELDNYRDDWQNDDWRNWSPKVKTRQNYRAPIVYANHNSIRDTAYQNNPNSIRDFAYQNNPNSMRDTAYQNNPNSMRDFGYQNNANSIRDTAYQNNYFRNSNKYSKWRGVQNYPISGNNYPNYYSDDYYPYNQKYNERGGLRSTWIAPVYSWHDQPNDISPITKELATLYNQGSGHRYRSNHYNYNMNRNPVRKYRYPQHSRPTSTSTHNTPTIQPDYWNPHSDRWGQTSNSWPIDIQNQFNRVRHY